MTDLSEPGLPEERPEEIKRFGASLRSRSISGIQTQKGSARPLRCSSGTGAAIRKGPGRLCCDQRT